MSQKLSSAIAVIGIDIGKNSFHIDQWHIPVSSRRLPKTGIFQLSAGDYPPFRSGTAQIRSLETHLQFSKARHWRAFLALPRVMSPGVGLVGWRRSADRTRLRCNPLLTGNFTGNFAILARHESLLLQETAVPQ
jgi:hypothetical protein